MRKLGMSFLFFVALNFSVLAQTGAVSRPRVVQPPPVLKGDETPTNKARRPPVLTDTNATPPSSPPATATKPTPANEEDEIVKVETTLVTTPVSVLDRNGRFIAGLKQKDFKILENGVPQKITYFQSEEKPFTVILMIDTSPSTKYHIDEIHFAAITFVNQLRPTDKVMVAAFDQRMKLLTPEPTSDRQLLYGAIYKAQVGSGTGLYDAVSKIANLDLIKTPGRKAVVLFTDGVDTTSRRASYESTIADIEEVDALFYPIRYNTQRRGPDVDSILASLPPGVQLPPEILARLQRAVIAGRGRSDEEYERGKLYLETLATNTGGRIFEADTIVNLETSFAGIAEELRRVYSVGYYPAIDGEPGERRQIKIQVARPPKAVVRSKTSYILKQNEPREAGAPASGLQG